MDFNLIPFGLSEKDGRFLDVSKVPRGKQCGCICPSCKTPLIARHGNINEWHFAHASRTGYLKTETECEFSFYVSVRLMARQIVDDTLSMALPAYTDCESAYLAQYDHYQCTVYRCGTAKHKPYQYRNRKKFLGLVR